MHAWHKLVPKTLPENLKFRRSLLLQAEQDPALQEQLNLACRENFLFWINTFGWIFEARERGTTTDIRELPWITWPVQDRAFRRIGKRIGKKPILVKKARDMSGSWMCLAWIAHRFTYRPLNSSLAVSRNESYVDAPGNPKSLFWKLTFFFERLPSWLCPRYKKTDMHLENLDNGAVIDGESTTGDVARGDRRSEILLDEFAAVKDDSRAMTAVRDATDCVIFNSTTQGPGTEFYREEQRLLKVDPEAVIYLPWWEHPQKGAGAYKSKDGQLVIVDETYKFPSDYPYVLDGRMRSPAYDDACRRRDPREIAREWDMDDSGATSLFFDASVIRQLIDTAARPPYRQGEIEFTLNPPEFVRWRDRADGPIKLWTHLDSVDRPSRAGNYFGGNDIAAGGSRAEGSNSVCSISDAITREKVLEFADPRLRPEKFAEIVFVLGHWFSGANGATFMAWEANGIGRIFTDRLIELGYPRFYYRRKETSITKEVTLTPGWWSTPDNKKALLGEYRRALESREFVNRSEWALSECLQYIYTANDSVDHVLAVNADDPTGAKANHGDRVIADALSLMLMGPAGQLDDAEPAPSIILPGSMAARDRDLDRDREQAKAW